MSNVINNLPEIEIKSMYENGNSENKISNIFGVSRAVIRRILLKNNTKIRSQSEAELMKWSLMTNEQRSNQVKLCHASVRGMKKTEETKHKIAIARQRNTPDWYIGVGEREFKTILTLEGIEFEYQKPVLGYNLDFFMCGVAIELTSFTGRNSAKRKPQQTRALNIFNEDKTHTLAVEIRDKDDIKKYHKEIVSVALELSNSDRNNCHYWIARCTVSGFSVEKITLRNL